MIFYILFSGLDGEEDSVQGNISHMFFAMNDGDAERILNEMKADPANRGMHNDYWYELIRFDQVQDFPGTKTYKVEFTLVKRWEQNWLKDN